MTYSFTGKSFAWVSLKASTRGKANIYVNGVLKATVDLKATSTLKQAVVWQTTYTTSAKRTVMIKVLGTWGARASTSTASSTGADRGRKPA